MHHTVAETEGLVITWPQLVYGKVILRKIPRRRAFPHEYSQIRTLSSNQVFLSPVRISALDYGIIYLPRGRETQDVEVGKTSVSGW